MENHLYVIYDRNAQYYIAPLMTARSDQEATRSFTEIVTSSGTPISQYPADFDLLRIGTIDLETGVLTPLSPSHTIINGLVCLTDAQRQRQRYQAILGTVEDGEPLPEAVSSN